SLRATASGRRLLPTGAVSSSPGTLRPFSRGRPFGLGPGGWQPPAPVVGSEEGRYWWRTKSRRVGAALQIGPGRGAACRSGWGRPGGGDAGEGPAFWEFRGGVPPAARLKDCFLPQGPLGAEGRRGRRSGGGFQTGPAPPASVVERGRGRGLSGRRLSRAGPSGRS